jgi:hypothetical protein
MHMTAHIISVLAEAKATEIRGWVLLVMKETLT